MVTLYRCTHEWPTWHHDYDDMLSELRPKCKPPSHTMMGCLPPVSCDSIDVSDDKMYPSQVLLWKQLVLCKIGCASRLDKQL